MASQAAVGIHQRADNTDNLATIMDANVGEESEMEVDESEEKIPTREHLLQRLRRLLNECLAREEFRDAAAVQQLVIRTGHQSRCKFGSPCFSPTSGEHCQRFACAFRKIYNAFPINNGGRASRVHQRI